MPKGSAYEDLMAPEKDKKKDDGRFTIEDLRKLIRGDKASEDLKAPKKKRQEETQGIVRG